MQTALTTTATNAMDGAIVQTEPHSQPPSRNPARVYLASLAPGSVPTMLGSLSVIAAFLKGEEPPKGTRAQEDGLDVPWGALRFQHTQAIRAHLAATYDYRTVNKMLSALRQTLKTAWRLGQMTADEYMTATDLKSVTGDAPDHAAGRALSLGELMALVASCKDGSPTGARDAAMLAVGYACGLRRAEIINLDLEHFDAAAGVLTVKGKRNKVRTVPIQNGARRALEAWLELRGEWAGPLFTRFFRSSTMTQDRMTTQAVYVIFARHAEAAGVKAFSPHDMRRTFAGDLLDAGADISTVQKMMGHSNVSTTAGYDRRGERAKQDAAKKLHFPF